MASKSVPAVGETRGTNKPSSGMGRADVVDPEWLWTMVGPVGAFGTRYCWTPNSSIFNRRSEEDAIQHMFKVLLRSACMVKISWLFV